MRPIFDTGSDGPAKASCWFKAKYISRGLEAAISVTKGKFAHTLTMPFVGDQYAEYALTTEQARLVYEHGYFDIIDGEITAVQM